MSDPTDQSQRIEDLEAQIAHLEATIQDLSDAAAKQWDIIDNLAVKVSDLTDRITALEGEMKQPSAEDEAPPHY